MRLPVLLILLTQLAVTGWLLPLAVARGAWARSRPLIGLIIVHGSALAHVVGTLVLGALAAHDAVEQAMIWLVHADQDRLHQAYAGDRRIDPAWDIALLLVVALLIALGLSTLRGARRVRLVRREHQLLRSVARRPEGDVTVLDNTSPAVWCVPGRRGGRIFVTTGTLDVLTNEELQAAFEHERAHLARHHHAMVFVADTITSVIGTYGFLRDYPALVRQLVELDADDAALRNSSPRVLASALLRLSEFAASRPSRVSLALNETVVGLRIRRLIDRQPTRGNATAALLAFVTSATAVLVPPAVVFLPALVLAGSGH